MNSILAKYADLLVNYCVELQPGERLFVNTTTLAQPLVREVYRAALKAGGTMDVNMEFREQQRILMQEAAGNQLKHINPTYEKAMREYDAYIYIRAPFNLFENGAVDPEKAKIRKAAAAPLHKLYFDRTGTRELKRNLCQYPTQAAAQNAGMSLELYQEFIFGACGLFKDDPKQSWLDRRADQQRIVDVLNACEDVHYKGNGIDIKFNTKGRTWINSDGQTNMPSGEIYTSPVENSVNGTIHFSYPGVYMGNEVEGVTLWVKDGYIEKWEAKRGMDFLNKIFAMDGTRRFGEAAIGTNYEIDRFTKNILFDEKIGGTVHMAIGQSYKQCGGMNESSVHWDMIAGMQDGGAIFANDEKIYENGQFLI